MGATVPPKLFRCKIQRNDTVGTLSALKDSCGTDAPVHRPTSQPMAPATPVKRTDAGTSLTKAAMCFGLRQPQQQCARVSIWVSKHTAAGCLA
jgi:hypothetical protein